MYEEIKFPLQEVLMILTGNYPLQYWLRRNAINALSMQKEDLNMREFDLDNPHFIARDSFIVVQFFKKQRGVVQG